jgi:sugar phosphate permease
MNWMTQYLMDVKGFSYFQVGQIASVGTIAGIPGCVIVSSISDRLKNRKLPLVGFASIYTIALAILIFLPASAPLIMYMTITFMLNFCGSFWVLFFSMIPETLPTKTAAIGLGIVNGAGTIGFSILAPIYGVLVDITGSYNASNMIVLGIAIVAPIIFGLLIKESYGQTPK